MALFFCTYSFLLKNALERICMYIKGIGLHIVNVDLDGFLYTFPQLMYSTACSRKKK